MKITNLTEELNQIRTKVEKKEVSIERLKKQLDKLNQKDSWIKVVLKPIAEELLKILNLPVYDILGPFGLDCVTSIHFAKDDKDRSDNSKIKSISFVPGEYLPFKLYVKDYNTQTHKYPQDSIGQVNDMNHPNVEVTDLTIQELADKWVL